MTALISKLNITTLFIYIWHVLNITMYTEVVTHSMNAYVWCWSKICGSLDKIPSVTVQQDFKGQGHYNKVKSKSHHDAAHLHPLPNVPTKYQLPTPYGFRDITEI